MFPKRGRLTKCVVVMLLCLTAAVSCGRRENPINERYQTDGLPTGIFTLAGEEHLLYPYGGKYYAASVTEGKMGVYDPAADMAYTPLAEILSLALFVDEEHIYLTDEDEVMVLDHAGVELHRYPVPVSTAEKGVYTELYVAEGQIYLLRTDRWAHQAWLCTIDEKDGTTTATDIQCDRNLLAAEYLTEQDGVLTMVYEYAAEGTNQIRFGLFRYENGELVWMQDVEGSWGFSYHPEENAVYGILQSLDTFQLLKTDTAAASGEENRLQVVKTMDQAAFMQSLSVEGEIPTIRPNLHLKRYLYHTGGQFVIWYGYYNCLFVYDLPTGEEEPLTVLYPVLGEFDPLSEELSHTVFDHPHQDMFLFEQETGIVTEAMTYPIKEFPDRLSMKLLAGETDFDIVYADDMDEGDLLSAILRYGLYLPLETYPEIMDQTEALAAGVLDYMTHDGHLIGFPYAIGNNFSKGNCFIVQPAFTDTGLPLPEADWTTADFWALCEAAIPFCKDGVALSMPVWPEMVMQILQYSAEKGSIDEDAIRETVEKGVYYDQLGVCAWNDTSPTKMLLQEIAPPNFFMNIKGYDDGAVLPFPSCEGKKYTTLQAFVFVNRNTKQPEKAVQYMSMLFSPAYIYEEANGKNYIGRQADAYYRTEWVPLEMLPIAEEGSRANTWNRYPARYSERNRYLMENMETAFAGNEILSINASEMWTMIMDMSVRLRDGEITTDAAVEAIIEFAASRLME